MREALEAADARGTDLLEILAALSPCKFQENTPADGAYVGFDVRHFLENTLDPRLQSYIMMSQKKAEWAGVVFNHSSARQPTAIHLAYTQTLVAHAAKSAGFCKITSNQAWDSFKSLLQPSQWHHTDSNLQRYQTYPCSNCSIASHLFQNGQGAQQHNPSHEREDCCLQPQVLKLRRRGHQPVKCQRLQSNICMCLAAEVDGCMLHCASGKRIESPHPGFPLLHSP